MASPVITTFYGLSFSQVGMTWHFLGNACNMSYKFHTIVMVRRVVVGIVKQSATGYSVNLPRGFVVRADLWEWRSTCITMMLQTCAINSIELTSPVKWICLLWYCLKDTTQIRKWRSSFHPPSKYSYHIYNPEKTFCSRWTLVLIKRVFIS